MKFYNIIVTPVSDEAGNYYTTRVLEFDGCIATGETKEEENEEGAVFEEVLRNLVYDFKHEANDDDFSNLNIRIDQYVNGELKERDNSLSHNLTDFEENEGSAVIFFKKYCS